MRTHARCLIAALLSALLLALAVGAAAASRLSTTGTGFKVTYSPISFVPSFGSTGRCPVTLEGSFHSRTTTKTSGTLAGFITRASMGTCESGRARWNTETLPWHVQYVSFEGTLPNITGITHSAVRPSWDVEGEVFGVRVKCRFTTPRQAVISTRESRGVIVSQSLGTESTDSETEGCPSGRLSGTGSVRTVTGGTIAVSLI